ncbi:proton-conducting transporter membrane subunit [Streptomyces sp. NBC_01613]|uniref:proton-conducting transporter transmembrane domain-containing protein n=1 Tax=Streptomyces sp. NBC_01613 TaxID=2975896 RepID=UPI003866F56B
MTHLGLVLMLAGFALFAAQTGGDAFAALRAGAHTVSPTVRGLVFIVVAAAFTSKTAAVLPHAWLPRVHPEAPSPVSALMSAIMVDLGIYGLVRTGLILLGGGLAWWWLGLIMVGGASAVYGTPASGDGLRWPISPGPLWAPVDGQCFVWASCAAWQRRRSWRASPRRSQRSRRGRARGSRRRPGACCARRVGDLRASSCDVRSELGRLADQQ